MRLSDEQIAKVCHEQNRAYCEVQGDNTQPSWESAPAWQQESAVKGVQAIREGRVTNPEDSHNSWLAEKREAGWVYGEVKDPETKTHPCIVEYGELPAAQRVKDRLFLYTALALIELE